MPELPEVERARALIAAQALNRRIVGVDDADSFVCRPHTPGQLREALVGRTLTAARRRGKTLWCETSGVGESTVPGPDLGIHLGMGGRIVVTSPGGQEVWAGEPFRRDAQPAKAQWDRFKLEFADGGSLALFDKRRLGRVRLNPDVDTLGPDAEDVTLAQFRNLIMKGTIAVKARLLDQSKIAGVGNLLADEALWQAKISPSARVNTLQRKDADRLYRALQAALTSAAAQGGVHTGEVIPARRPGGTCPRCGAEMVHGTVGGRSTWWCSREQRLRPLRNRFCGPRQPGYGGLTQARTAGHQRSREATAMVGPRMIGPGEHERRSRPLLRTKLGEVLRRTRQEQGRTLADVSRAARVSMPYLSEIERGRKEASSEVLAAICDALHIEVSDLLVWVGRDLVGDRARRAPVIPLDAVRSRRAPQPHGPGDIVGLAA